MNAEQKGLRLAAGITVLTGLAFAAAAFPPANFPALLLFDLLIWPVDAGQTLAAPETRLGLAISGGLMAGWGCMIWQLAGEPFSRAPDGIRRIILGSLLVWFTVDSTASVVAGAALNFPANAGFLALYLVPILVLRPVAKRSA